MSIFDGINRAAGMMGIMGPASLQEAANRAKYVKMLERAGMLPPGAKVGGMAGATGGIPGIASQRGAGRIGDDGFGPASLQEVANRANYVNMLERAGMLPPGAKVGGMAGPRPVRPGFMDAARTGLERLAGGFVDDKGGLQVIPGALNAANTVQRGITNAAGDLAMSGVRAVPRIGRRVVGAGLGMADTGLNVLGAIGRGLF